MSHAHEDRSFARRLMRDLTAKGVRVWIDEAEMAVGDALLERLTQAIDEMDFLGVVISGNSAGSDWVEREVAIAMRGEIAGKTVKVLPLMLRGGELPPSLEGKTFADFTSEPKYDSSLAEVLARLGVQPPAPYVATDRLTELTDESPLLRAAMLELRSDALSKAMAEALVTAAVDDFDLAEFFTLMAAELAGDQLYALAITLIPCIDRRGVGHKALDSCLEPGRLEGHWLEYVGMHMQDVETPDAVAWCHSRLTAVIRSDSYYHSFLVKHAEFVVDACFDEMATYLLSPNRGPGFYNVDSFSIVLGRTDQIVPFEQRWIDWLDAGYFDRESREGDESADTHYRILNEHWGEAAFASVVEATHRRLHLLLKSQSEDMVRNGLYHLVAMVDARYRGADRVLVETVPRVYRLPPDQRKLLDALASALRAVADLHQDPSDALDKVVARRYAEVRDADRTGISGFWAS